MRRILTITFIMLGGFGAASAQYSGQSRCETRSFAFPCPVRSDVLLSGGAEGLFVTKGHRPVATGLFALEIGDASADEKSLDVLLDRVFLLLYSRRFTDFQFKESREFRNAPEWQYSKFEEMRYQKVAFDDAGSELLHTHVVVFSFNGKRIMAGFVRSFLTGDLARSSFKGWTMGAGNGPSELRRLITSITKEKEPGEWRQKPAAAAAPK